LAIEPPAFRESVRNLLDNEFDIEVVGAATRPLDLLVKVGSTQADVLVHSWPIRPEMPGICTNLLTEYPELTIIGISSAANRIYRCRQEITVTPCVMLGLEDLLPEIRSLSAEALKAV
jgi:DNA-binding NarL/FixJ family response regulator